MVDCAVTCISITMGINLLCHDYGIVIPSIRITSKICLLTTLADKDNPSSDTLLSGNSSNSQETFVEGWLVHF